MKKALLIIGAAILVGLSIYFIAKVEKLNSKSIEFLSAVPDNAYMVIGANDVQKTILKFNETSSVWKDMLQSPMLESTFSKVSTLASLFDLDEATKMAVVYTGNKDKHNEIILMNDRAVKQGVADIEKTFNKTLFHQLKADSVSFYIYRFKEFIYASTSESSIQDVITSVNSNAFINSKVLAETSIKKTEAKDFYILLKGSINESQSKNWVYYDGEIAIDDITLITGYHTKSNQASVSTSLTGVLPIKYNYDIEAIADSNSFASEVAYISNNLGRALVFKLSKSIKYTTLQDLIKSDSLNNQKFWLDGSDFKSFFDNVWLRSDTLYGSEDVDFAVVAENEKMASTVAFELRNQSFEEEENLFRSSLFNTNQSDSELPIVKLFSNTSLVYSHKYYYSSSEHLTIEKVDIQHPIKTEEIKKEHLWQKSIEGGIAQGPFIIKNHRTNNQEILIVDNKNQLKLYGINGDLKWTKPLNGKIIGGVEQVDILNNKKLQLLFNTSSKLYMLDILGRDVDGFPVSFKETITNQVAPIDYDGSKNYRFIVATDKQLVAFDKNGKRVSGFGFQLKSNVVKSKVVHVLLSGKDYLMFNDASGKIHFLNRKGEVRYTSSAQSKKVDVFSSLNVLSTISSSTLYDIDSLGRVVEINLAEKSKKKVKDSIVTNHLLVTEPAKNKKYFVGIKERELSVYNKTADKLNDIICDFAPKTAELFFTNGKLNKVLIQSVNNELFIYNVATSFFEKSYMDVSSISSIHDFDGNGKYNFIAIQNNMLTCFELE